MGIPIIGDLIESVVGKAGDIASELITDKDKKAQLQFELERLKVETADKAEQRVHEQMVAQIEVNKTEASHKSVFVAGWRPAVGWVGVVGLFYSFVLEPLMSWTARILGYVGNFPELQTEAILFLLSGMLGFGGLRSWEKIKGVQVEDPSPLVVTKKTNDKKPVDLVPDVLKRTPPENAPW